MMSYQLQQASIDLKFNEITYCVSSGRRKGYKTIVKGVSGGFRSGQLSAILGPSGAGKTTLLNILSGLRTSKVSGEILVNGNPRNSKCFRRQSCYIMQDGELLQYLTIQESMQAAACLKLGSNVSKNEKNIKINEILDNLNLQECKNTRVGNLSGGEKKRLSFAFELVNNPPVMFLDEPTSGLDSQNSYHCIRLLKKLAEDGRTIICAIHQPSARLFEIFDYLYAMADGHCIYRGTIPDLIPFLSSLGLECPAFHNPADFLIEIASGEYGNLTTELVHATNKEMHINTETKQQHDLVSSSQCSSQNESENENGNDGISSSNADTRIDLVERETFLKRDEKVAKYPTSFMIQFYVLLIRTFRSILRDPMLTLLRLAAHIVVGIFIGILYYKIGNDASYTFSNIGYLFFSLLFLVYTSMMPTIVTFPLEMKVFVREHLNNWYSLKAYYLAKTMADIPFQLVFTIIFITIAYFMTNQPYEASRFFLIATICVLTSLVSQSIGLAISAAMNIEHAVFFGPASTIPFLLFSGFFATFSTIPVYLRWVTYLSYVRYGYEGSIRVTYGYGREPLYCSEAFCLLKSPTKIMEQFEIEEQGLWIDMLLLSIYFVVMRILGFFIFRWKLKSGR